MNTIEHNRFRAVVSGQLSAEKWSFVLAFLCTFSIALADLLKPWPLKLIVDHVLLAKPLPAALSFLNPFVQHDRAVAVVGIASLLILLSLVKGFSVYSQIFITSRIGYRLAHTLRRELFAHLQRLSLAFHKRSQAGELLTKLTSDTNTVRDTFSEFALTLVTEALTLVGMVVIMLFLNVQLSLVVLATFPVLGAISIYRFRSIRDSARRQRSAEGRIASRVSEILNSITIVQAFGQERYESERFENESAQTLRQSIRTARLEAASSRAADIVSALGTFAVLVVGSLQALSGHITPGSLLVFVSYMSSIYGPIRTLAKLSAKISRATVGAGRIREVLAIEPEIEDKPSAIQAPQFHGGLSFRNVSFEYDRGKRILNDISFEITPGQHVALLGASGAGKSTIISLILRLYDFHDGEILVDGVSIKNFKRESLRQQLGIVLQDTLLFGTSIKENIAYGKVDATFDEIVGAAKAANAHDFIMRLKDGYDTIVGERGGTLSGGQRQRLAIARAFIRNVPILILDEPMTGLDVESEQSVREALDRLMMGKTCLLITHDLAAASVADNVILLDQGRIVEQGTPAELATQRSRYRELYDKSTPFRTRLQIAV
ncbi:MAG TPA: ABC transporter ATP-binding protein [Pyrinomonadaceae bacterium]|nr:ABC transporter ATP-binding protein [Pyrinomonadaceae bacterium]